MKARYPRAPPSPDDINRHHARRRRTHHASDRHGVVRVPAPSGAMASLLIKAARTPLPETADHEAGPSPTKPPQRATVVPVVAPPHASTTATGVDPMNAVVQLCIAMTSVLVLGVLMVLMEQFV